jgi:predicted nucleic acid-binding protein
MKSFFPDVNLWVALAYRGHRHYSSAIPWLGSLEDETAHFCRVTQLRFLRLVSHPRVMGEDRKTQAESWHTYDVFLSDNRVSLPSRT